MQNPLLSPYLFLAVSILLFIAAVINISDVNSMDDLYLATSLICGLVSLAKFRKPKQSDVAIHFST
jgi:hypothetical protein